MTPRDEGARHLEIVADGDRQELEALQLEIRRLAREHGVEIVRVEIVPAAARRRVSARRPARRRRG